MLSLLKLSKLSLSTTHQFRQNTLVYIKCWNGQNKPRFNPTEMYEYVAEEEVKEISQYKVGNPDTGRHFGAYKMSFHTEEVAEKFYEDRMNYKSNGRNIMVDLAKNQTKLHLYCKKGIDAEKISELGLFRNLTSITEIDKHYHTLEFDNHVSADSCFQAKIDKKIRHLGGKGFSLSQPGCRQMAGQFSKGGNNTNINSIINRGKAGGQQAKVEKRDEPVEVKKESEE